jgi:hypothetical protein
MKEGCVSILSDPSRKERNRGPIIMRGMSVASIWINMRMSLYRFSLKCVEKYLLKRCAIQLGHFRFLLVRIEFG